MRGLSVAGGPRGGDARPDLTPAETGGGEAEDATGRKCLCNGLMATVGLGQHRRDGYQEPALATLGQSLDFLPHMLPADVDGYTAEQVVDYLLKDR